MHKIRTLFLAVLLLIVSVCPSFASFGRSVGFGLAASAISCIAGGGARFTIGVCPGEKGFKPTTVETIITDKRGRALTGGTVEIEDDDKLPFSSRRSSGTTKTSKTSFPTRTYDDLSSPFFRPWNGSFATQKRRLEYDLARQTFASESADE